MVKRFIYFIELDQNRKLNTKAVAVGNSEKYL